MQTLGHLLVTGGEFVAILALFSRFGSLSGWTLEEICVFYGVVNVVFAIADSITAGFDRLSSLVKRGEFDRYLLRPRGVILQLLGYEFTLRRFGRLAQGIAVLAYGLSQTVDAASVGLFLQLAWTMAGGVAFFVALLIFQATLAFKTVEVLEIMNVFTYGGMEAAQYPFPIYPRWFRRIFTLVVPLGAISYYPCIALIGRADPNGTAQWIGWMSPAAGFAFLAAALLVWKIGMRWYQSTGS